MTFQRRIIIASFRLRREMQRRVELKKMRKALSAIEDIINSFLFGISHRVRVFRAEVRARLGVVAYRHR